MQNLNDVTGKVLLEIAMKDKTGWRIQYLHECGLIDEKQAGYLNAQLRSRTGFAGDYSSQQR